MEKTLQFIRRVAPTLIMLALFTLQVWGQQPGQGGDLLNNDTQRAVSLIKRIVDVFAWGMLIGGIFAIGRGVFLGWRGGSGAITSIAWGMGGVGFGFLVSWINAEVGGNSVNLPTP
jgi:hypothetical protein